MGRYDLPAKINYILSATQREKLIYLGYSMGTTMFWIAMDYHPQLNAKIEFMVAMAPVSTIASTKSPFVRIASPFVRVIEVINNVTLQKIIFLKW